MVSGHLVGKKAWQDLACLFKNQVWVGGDYSTFCLSLSLYFLCQKWKKKLHLNWCQLASLQHSENRAAFGLVAQGDPGLAPFLLGHRAGQSWPGLRATQAERRQHEKGQRQQRAVILGAMGTSPLVHAGPEAQPTPWAAQSRLRLRRGRASPRREEGRQPERALVERVLTNWKVMASTWDTGLLLDQASSCSRGRARVGGEWPVCLGG